MREYLVYLCLYVDDGLLMSASKDAIFVVLDYLKSHFDITSDIANKYIGFGIERNRDKKLLKISQAGCIRKILENFRMIEANALNVPGAPGSKLQTSSKIGTKLFESSIPRSDWLFTFCCENISPRC